MTGNFSFCNCRCIVITYKECKYHVYHHYIHIYMYVYVYTCMHIYTYICMCILKYIIYVCFLHEETANQSGSLSVQYLYLGKGISVSFKTLREISIYDHCLSFSYHFPKIFLDLLSTNPYLILTVFSCH